MPTIKRLRFLFLIIIIFISVFYFSSSPSKVFASTIVEADIIADTTWTKGNSPYVISNYIDVVAGATLTIDPGVIVKFDYDSSLDVLGSIEVNGTASEKVSVSSLYDSIGVDLYNDCLEYMPDLVPEEGVEPCANTNQDEVDFPWLFEAGGIYLDGASDSSFQSVLFSHLEYGLYFDNTPGTVENIEIADSPYGITVYGSDVSISDSTFENIYDEDAIVLDSRGIAEISNIQVKSSFDYGALTLYGSKAHIVDSVFEGVREVDEDGYISQSDSAIEIYDEETYDRVLRARVVTYQSELNASGLKISGHETGLEFYGGMVNIEKTKIFQNYYGLEAYLNDGSIVTITESSIVDNDYATYISREGTINAINNYWGDPTGPFEDELNPGGLGGVIEHYENNITFIPWLTSDPLEKPVCCSSVLFLPGIKGSILEKGSDMLWPPTAFSLNDVNQLALTSDGASVNDIHTDGVLNTFKGTPIYAPFSNFMDGLVADNTIKEWLPLAYDWRFSPETILADGIKTKNETINVIEKIKTLAQNSKNGKITIVAHSMGGLLGKAIIKKLSEEGKDNLIDSFVMVGSPQLGTPQAIASILHGDDEGIPPVAGFIVNPIGIRRIAQNMPSAYNLLPSPQYFSSVSDPVIKFNSEASFTKPWRDFWGATISTYPKFLEFMTGTGVTRAKPVEQKLPDPEVLSSIFMTNAANFHNLYDNYQFPDHIRVVQVAGWGSHGKSAVEYKNYHGYPSYEVSFTREGDRTVVYPSAISSVADETYFFNLFEYNKLLNSNTQHRDLLSASPVQTLFTSIVKKEDVLENNFILTAKPQVVDLTDQLVVSTHSPVILGAYDQLGNFTGINPNQNLSADFLSISENIPGSAFIYTSESQNIFLPKEGNYNFVYKGTGNGSTTVEIDNFSADMSTPVASYTDIPTTSNTKAAFTVQSSAPENTEIALDANGDGTTDEVVLADGVELSLNQLITLIKEKISTLSIKDKLKQNLLKQIANLEKKIENKKQKNIKILANLDKKISKQEMKGKISTADAAEITNLLDLLEAQSENIALDPTILASLKTKIQSLNVKANLKNDLLKRVEKLEKKGVIIKTLSNLSKNIIKKAGNGKIADADAQALIDLLNQIEGVI